MFAQLKPALILFALLTLLTGVLYPAVITGIAQVVFPRQANGSLIEANGQVVGSALIGQPFDDPKYFWGRLSATGALPLQCRSIFRLEPGTDEPGARCRRSRRAWMHCMPPTRATPSPSRWIW